MAPHRARNNRDKRCEFEDSVSQESSSSGSSSGSKPYFGWAEKKARLRTGKEDDGKSQGGLPWCKSKRRKNHRRGFGNLGADGDALRLLNRSAKTPSHGRQQKSSAKRFPTTKTRKSL